MKKGAATLKGHSKKIVNYFYSGLTNAVWEGINSMIQAAKHKACGCHAYERLETMICLVGAKLGLA